MPKTNGNCDDHLIKNGKQIMYTSKFKTKNI